MMKFYSLNPNIMPFQALNYIVLAECQIMVCFMFQCSGCKKWYHPEHQNITEDELSKRIVKCLFCKNKPKSKKIQAKLNSNMKTLNKEIFIFFILFLYRHARDGKTRDSRDGTIQCPVFTDTQPGLDCPVFSTRKHGTAGTGQSNGRDNPMSRIFRHTTGTGHCMVPSRLSRVFSLKTRDSRDGTIQCPLFSDTQPGRDIGLSRPGCPVFSTRKHGTAGTGPCNVPSRLCV